VYEPFDPQYMPENTPQDQWLDKAGATINYRDPYTVENELIMLSVHPSGDPEEDQVTLGIQNLARLLKSKSVPSIFT
jgi:hypothetical protein